MDLEKTRKWIVRNKYHGMISNVAARSNINIVTVHEHIYAKRPVTGSTMAIFKASLECIKEKLGREMK